MISIRGLGPKDIPAARAFWVGVPGLGLSSADEPEALARFFARNPGLSWGAYDGDRLVATVLAGHDARRGFLYHLAVSPDHRGQGLSTELMSRALEALVAEGVEKVHAFVLADNAQGLAFWAAAARRGWHRRGDLLLFSKTLSLGS
ncbi:MAG TPA: GNAT family N-acetyltransferase [Spirochaetia bacterium]|nr:GNAT family N-acetyltransferase [Spirochaetia bacterium]